VAVLGHSHVRQLQVFRNSMRSRLTEAAAPGTGALRLRVFADFENTPWSVSPRATAALKPPQSRRFALAGQLRHYPLSLLLPAHLDLAVMR